ncbi:MAG: nuclear transport factor 2 family protein [Bryobacteraceae bacterium]
MRALIVFLLAVVLAPCAVTSEDELRQAEKAWAAAVTGRDFAALDRLLHDELIYAHSTGVIEAKAQYTGRLRSGAQRYDRIEHEKMTVKLHGDAAVVHSIVRMTGEADKRPFDNRLMMIHFWVKQDGQWRLAAHQTTELKAVKQ